MICYKKITEITENSFIINGEAFGLQECTDDEIALVNESLKELWYIRMCAYSEEEDGGWSGTTSSHSVYWNIKAENAVIDSGKVIGFRINDEKCDREVCEMFFSIEEAGTYYPIKRVRYYSFDGGDGDGVTSYSFALEKKDKKIVDFINTFCVYEEWDHWDNKGERSFEYKEIDYDSVFVNTEGNVIAHIGCEFLRAEDEGKVIRLGGHNHKTLTLKRK